MKALSILECTTVPFLQKAVPFLKRAVVPMSARRNVIRAAVDVAAWSAGIAGCGVLGAALDSEGRLDRSPIATLVVAAVAGQLLIGWRTGLYRGYYRTGSFDEAGAIARTWLLALVPFGVAMWVIRAPALALIAVGGAMTALAAMFASRLVWRSVAELSSRPPARGRRRVLVFGAGEGGQSIIRSMMTNPGSRYVPVGLLDDDPAKRHRSINGIKVCGTRNDIEAAARAVQADVLLIAVPSASAALVGDLFDGGTAAGLAVLTLAPAAAVFGRATVADIRPLQEADLLGRDEVEIDLDAIVGYITGRKVLVTGAGGSIGSELCRQLYRLAPAELLMLDRDESALHALQLAIEGHALLDCSNLIVADIRDRERIEQVFARHTPNVVFHASALKHVSLLEQHPHEGVKTNIVGTQNVLDAAVSNGVERFVNISTDKAADPISVLGATKRVGEALTTDAAEATGRGYVSVRFGNVLGSRGSVLPTFRHQIAQGGPLTVTDPEATRYFMTTSEAVRLVLQAGAIGRPGEIMILDMGEPVRIVDLARRLINHHDPSVSIVFTGLRPGEKRHETLVSRSEIAVRREHPRILHTDGVGLRRLKEDGVAPVLVAGMADSLLGGGYGP